MPSAKLKKSAVTKREKLEESVKESTDKVRYLFYFFLAPLIYVLMSVFFTTDTMLLLADVNLKLPVIELNVPLIGFYFLIPLFVVIFHFYLLKNLESHQDKLMKWQRAWNGSIPRENIPLLLFNLSSLDKEAPLKFWVNLASNIFYIYLATFTLAIIFWRFADYQSGYMSTWHLILLLIDMYFVIKINQAFAKNSSANNQPKSKWVSKAMWLLIALVMTIKIMAVIWIDFTEDNTFAKQSYWIEYEYKKIITTPFCNVTNWLHVDFLGCHDITNFVFWNILPHISIPPGENLLPPDSKLSALAQSAISKEDPVLSDFNHRDVSIELSGRSLRMAFLGSAVLPNVGIN